MNNDPAPKGRGFLIAEKAKPLQRMDLRYKKFNSGDYQSGNPGRKLMKCSRTACQADIGGEQHLAIWNEPSTNQPRLYCMPCGVRIIRGNERDDLKLKREVRNPVTAEITK